MDDLNRIQLVLISVGAVFWLALLFMHLPGS